MKKVKRIYKYLKEKYEILTSKKYTTIAGTLVYFFIMSVIPFSFWLTLFFGKLIDADSEVILSLEVFKEFEDLLIFLRENAKNAAGGVNIILAVSTLYSSTNLFYHMRRSGELIYDYNVQKGGVKVRFSALVLIFLMIFLFAFFLLVLASGYYILSRYFDSRIGKIFSYIFLICMSFLLAFILNWYICPYKLKVKEVLPGSIATTVLWGVAASAFTVYLKLSDMSKLYGAVSAIIVFLLWLYVMMNCFVIGVIFNSERIKKLYDKELKKF